MTGMKTHGKLALVFAGQIRTGEDPRVLRELARRLSYKRVEADALAHLSPMHRYGAWHGAPMYNNTSIPMFERVFRREFQPVHLVIATDEQVVARCSELSACSHRWRGPVTGDVGSSDHSVLYFRLLLLHDALVARERALRHSYAFVLRLRTDTLPDCNIEYAFPTTDTLAPAQAHAYPLSSPPLPSPPVQSQLIAIQSNLSRPVPNPTHNPTRPIQSPSNLS